MWMGPRLQHDNEPCLTHQSCLLPIVGWIWSVLLAIRGANEEKSCEPERRSCKPTPTIGWEPLAMQAMEITEGNCCVPFKRSKATRKGSLCLSRFFCCGS